MQSADFQVTPWENLTSNHILLVILILKSLSTFWNILLPLWSFYSVIFLLYCSKVSSYSSLFFLRYIYFTCMNTLLLFSDTPEEATDPHYRWLWATMWLLGIELRTSGRAVSALNLWAISPALALNCCWSFHFGLLVGRISFLPLWLHVSPSKE